MKQHSHSIHHTFIDRHGVVSTRVNCTCHGTTDREAHDLFDHHVRFVENAWAKGTTWNGVPVRITGITLVTAAGEQLAAWTRPVEGMVAA